MALLENLRDCINNCMVSAENYSDPCLSLQCYLLILCFPSCFHLPPHFHSLYLFCGVPIAEGRSLWLNTKLSMSDSPCLDILG